MRYLFYDPHPGGIAGALAPLPPSVKEAIDGIARMGIPQTKRQVTIKILMAIAVDVKHGIIKRDARIVESKNYDMICLCVGDSSKGEREDCWRLLMYKKAEGAK